jgi:hypothetical protein
MGASRSEVDALLDAPALHGNGAPYRTGSLYFFQERSQAIFYATAETRRDEIPRQVYGVRCKGRAWGAAIALANMALQEKDADKRRLIAEHYWFPGDQFTVIEYLTQGLEVTSEEGDAAVLELQDPMNMVVLDWGSDQETMRSILREAFPPGR